MDTVIPAVMELDGWSLSPLEPDDAPLLVDLLQQRGNRYVLDLPPDEAVLRRAIIDLPTQPYTMPVAIERDGAVVGMASTAIANVRSLNVSLLALFVDPPSSAPALALYLRHAFWTYPIHRVYCHLPAMDLCREYVDLLAAVGFQDEGRLVQHAIIGGQPFDMVVLGLLRSDFEAWCDANEPRLAFRS